MSVIKMPRRSIDDGLTPDQRKRTGLVFLGVGAMAWIGFAVMFGSITNARKAAAEHYADATGQCATRLSGLGGQVTVVGDRLLWSKNGDNSVGESRVGELSVAAAACPGWTMVNACLGEACDGGRTFSIVLRPIDPKL